jgi:cytochrome c oxidase subunit 1
VVAITIVLVAAERALHLGIFDPKLGGDPLLFQHLFWFYSHPAVYIMILPSMGVVSEIIACFSRKRIFGYSFIAILIHRDRGLRLSGLGAPHVRGWHVGLRRADLLLLSYSVAVPSAIKVFNWTATLYKGSIHYDAPMLYAFGFLGLFTIGGLTGLFLWPRSASTFTSPTLTSWWPTSTTSWSAAR